MTAPNLTPAQRAALEWLAPIGQWTLKRPRMKSKKLRKLMELGLCCALVPPGGTYWQWRITPAGQQALKDNTK